MNIHISLPIRSVVNAVTKPVVAVAQFVGRGVNAVFQFASRGLAAAARVVAHTPSNIRNGASVSAHFIAHNAASAAAFVKSGVVALGSAATTFVTTVAVAAWGYAQFGFAVLFSTVGNIVHATVVPAIVWSFGSKATAIGLAAGAVFQWIAVIALPIVVLGGIMAAITNVSARRKAVLAAQGIVADTGILHEVQPADGPDPVGAFVKPETDVLYDSANDEDEANKSAEFIAVAKAWLDDNMTIELIRTAADKAAADYARALPLDGSGSDYRAAGVELRNWIVANKEIANRARVAMNAFNDTVKARKTGQQPALSIVN